MSQNCRHWRRIRPLFCGAGESYPAGLDGRFQFPSPARGRGCPQGQERVRWRHASKQPIRKNIATLQAKPPMCHRHTLSCPFGAPSPAKRARGIRARSKGGQRPQPVPTRNHRKPCAWVRFAACPVLPGREHRCGNVLPVCDRRASCSGREFLVPFIVVVQASEGCFHCVPLMSYLRLFFSQPSQNAIILYVPLLAPVRQ
jgi:hypothetical protein